MVLRLSLQILSHPSCVQKHEQDAFKSRCSGHPWSARWEGEEVATCLLCRDDDPLDESVKLPETESGI